MPPETTNLLPEDRTSALRRDYFLRLGALALGLVTLLIVGAGVFLVPTYIFLRSQVVTKTARLADINASLAATDDASLSARLSALSSDATILKSLATMPSATAIIRDELAVSRPGITLSTLSYTPASGQGPGTLVVSGTAATRDTLRAYQTTLGAAPFAASVDLPVSVYAKDTNIAFTITITLAP